MRFSMKREIIGFPPGEKISTGLQTAGNERPMAGIGIRVVQFSLLVVVLPAVILIILLSLLLHSIARVFTYFEQ